MLYRIHTHDSTTQETHADRVVRDDDTIYLDRQDDDGWAEVARFSVDDVAEVRRRATGFDGRWFWMRCRMTYQRDRFDVTREERV